ncbi:MAG: (deoxy)nucleoside triphosphate pyrophosphohydrolase [Verrucomicrobiota bacterium]
MKQNVIEVSAGLIFREGKLLITQRRAQDHLGGLWEFPGGKREGDETDEDCLRRELREELGVEVEVGELLETLTHDYVVKTVCLKFFRCALRKNEPRSLACSALAWVTPEELVKFAFPAADAKLLANLRATPEWWRSN